MGVSLRLVNADAQFNLRRSEEIVIINDVPVLTEADKEALNRLIYTKHNGDLLSNIPSCSCGYWTTEQRVGQTCPKCKTVCVRPLGDNLQPSVYMRAPKGVLALINPTAYFILCKKFNYKSTNIIRWLTETTYRSNSSNTELIDQLRNEFGIVRGYNNFVQNFDAIMNVLFELPAFRVKRGKKDEVREFIQMYRDNIFSQYLPLPNKSILIVEKSGSNALVDPVMVEAIDAIRTIASIDTPLELKKIGLKGDKRVTFGSLIDRFKSAFKSEPKVKVLSDADKARAIRVRENRTIKVIDSLASFYSNIDRDVMAPKSGVFRKHIHGFRAHFTFRTVVTSITKPHRYDEIHIPWGLALNVFNLHLRNLLEREGMSPTDITKFVNAHAGKYNAKLDGLFRKLIMEAPGGKGIPVIMQRNPSLMRGSLLLVYITEIKTEIEDPTVSFSDRVTKSMNADDPTDAFISISRTVLPGSNSW